MKLTILGSAGCMPTPRPLCQCSLCKKARKLGEPYKRNCSSMFFNDINALFDCPEDIADSLNSRNIKKVDHLFLTHWHPDHTFGLRLISEAYFDFITGKCKKQIVLHLPKRVFNYLKKYYPSLLYHIDVLKTIKVKFIEHNTSVKINNAKITAIGFTGKKSHTFGYLIESNKKRVFYSPCDTLEFDSIENNSELKYLDLLITECGIFSYKEYSGEISFLDLIKRINISKPKRTILTHIEELELKKHGWDMLEKLEKKHKNLKFAYDGMDVNV